MRVVFLGTYHPHVFHRATLLKQRENVEIVGYWEQDEEVSLKLEERLGMPRFQTAASLLAEPFDIAFIHSLDADVPRLALMAADAGAKGLLLEKPGAAQPEQIYELAEKLAGRNVVVEFGWELHYAEVMDYARDLVRTGVLGEITTSRFHGGCPSGAGAELWSRLETNPGGLMYEEACHTLENIIDLFGLPTSLSASVRKLPLGTPHPIISCFYDMKTGALDPKTTKMAVGDILYEDIGSVILEYEHQNVVADFTSWEPTYWCEDWSIDIYGTNGVFHGTMNPPAGTLLLREGKDKFPQGTTIMPVEKGKGVRNEKSYYTRQVDLFLQRSMDGIDTEKCDMGNEIKLMKVLQAIYKSAKTRSFVEI